MNGQDHYRAAEKILHELGNVDYVEAEQIARVGVAQVHATLALAAATALEDSGIREQERWILAVYGKYPDRD